MNYFDEAPLVPHDTKLCLNLWYAAQKIPKISFEMIWSLVKLQWSDYDLLWHICSHWNVHKHIQSIHNLVYKHPKRKFCLFAHLPQNVRHHIYHFLDWRDWQTFSHTTSKYLCIVWPGEECWHNVWRQIMAIEDDAHNLLNSLREVIGDLPLMKLLIFDKRLITIANYDMLEWKISQISEFLADDVSDDEITESVDEICTTDEEDESVLNILYDDIIFVLLQFMGFQSYWRLARTNTMWYDKLSAVETFVNLPAFQELRIVCCDKFKWDHSISTLFWWQFIKHYEFHLAPPFCGLVASFCMPFWLPKWLKTYQGDVWALKPDAGECKHIENLWLNRVRWSKHVHHTAENVKRWFLSHCRRSYPTYSISCQMFIGAASEFSTSNLHRLCVRRSCKTIILWYCTIYHDLANFNDAADILTYPSTHNKHLVSIGKNEWGRIRVLTQFPWFTKRIMKFTVVCQYFNNNAILFLSDLLNNKQYPHLKHVYLFNYQLKYQHLIWLWFMKNLTVISDKFDSFICIFFVGDINDTLKIICFDMVKLISLNQIRHYQTQCLKMFIDDNYHPTDTNALDLYNNLISLFL